MYLKSQNSFLAADYLRLSSEDGDKAESDSIRNQRSLIQDFVKKHSDISLVEEYVDDGYSGANFHTTANRVIRVFLLRTIVQSLSDGVQRGKSVHDCKACR